MKNSKFKIQTHRLLFCVMHLALCMTALYAQSTNQSFPTPVTSNEINGTIRARDIGDARLTSYFYVFNGNQGDIFINVVTKNLDGDIDVFTADGLRPLTKIRVYSDNPEAETGRVVYLRQPQKLILRIEGRTPTDDPASFRIKFAGSFQAVTGGAVVDEKDPQVAGSNDSDVRVNSVGTIIEIKPKPTPTPKPEIARVETEESKERPEKQRPETEEPENRKKDDPVEEKPADKKPEVVITENLPEKSAEKADRRDETVAENEKPTEKIETETPVKPKRTRTPKTRTEKKTEIAPINPSELGNIRLVVDFKDGRKIERPMSEILKFGVDKGILTIIAKDGSIGRYSILDVARITVE